METKIEKLIIFGSSPNNGIYNVLSNIGDNVNYKYNCEICVEKFQCDYDMGVPGPVQPIIHNLVLSLNVARDSYDNINAGNICQSKILDTFQTSNIAHFVVANTNTAIYDVINQVEFWFKTNKYDLNNLSLKFQTLSNGVLSDLVLINNLSPINFVLHLKLKFYL